ncbi:MAG TPA: exosortase/archaeosortase family protein [Chthoniobacterales bacterium]|nr:exosortase/archaeosortase family protein [Chthoniobacterales bacterium]
MSKFRDQAVPWIVPGVLWFWLFFHLRAEWTLNPQYNYGWAVPFLALLLFYFRWQRRPDPDPAGRQHRWPATGIWLLLVILFPIRVIEEANPDWRLLSWILAFDVIAISLLSVFRAGGKSWLKHFAFPVCLPLAAVPWPVQFENLVVQGMMRAVAYVAVEIAGWLGVGAYQIGNVIQLRNGFVGVDEACSGVKTLQAGILVALVLGELFRLPSQRRIALGLLGCAWIFVCNVFRATTLVLVAANSGLDSLGRWHDTIGTAALLCGMAGIMALAWLWKLEPPEIPLRAKTSSILRQNFGAHFVALAWLALIFAGTEVWYRIHERNLVELPRWQPKWPQANGTMTHLSIAETTRVILRYDDAESAAWEDPRGVRWWSFFAAWKPQRAALQLVRSHSPEICLPAIGRTFRSARPDLSLRAGASVLDFQSYEFEQEGRPLFVFVCIQEDKRVPSDEKQPAEWNLQGRVRAAFQGKRNLGQRLLEIAVTGLDDSAKARDAVARTVNEMVAVEQPKG